MGNESGRGIGSGYVEDGVKRDLVGVEGSRKYKVRTSIAASLTRTSRTKRRTRANTVMFLLVLRLLFSRQILTDHGLVLRAYKMSRHTGCLRRVQRWFGDVVFKLFCAANPELGLDSVYVNPLRDRK